MSSGKRKAKKKVTSSKSLKKQEDLIDFDSWFWFQTQGKKVRDSQKNEIRVFFDKKGLKNRETKSRYEEILKLY